MVEHQNLTKSVIPQSRLFIEPYTFSYLRFLGEVVARKRYSRRAIGQKQVLFMLLIGDQPHSK